MAVEANAGVAVEANVGVAVELPPQRTVELSPQRTPQRAANAVTIAQKHTHEPKKGKTMSRQQTYSDIVQTTFDTPLVN